MLHEQPTSRTAYFTNGLLHGQSDPRTACFTNLRDISECQKLAKEDCETRNAWKGAESTAPIGLALSAAFEWETKGDP